MLKHVPDSVLYGQRLLVFFETEPQSNTYRQVCLSEKDFRRVSKSLGKIVGKVGCIEHVTLDVSEQEYTLPDLREVYPT